MSARGEGVRGAEESEYEVYPSNESVSMSDSMSTTQRVRRSKGTIKCRCINQLTGPSAEPVALMYKALFTFNSLFRYFPIAKFLLPFFLFACFLFFFSLELDRFVWGINGGNAITMTPWTGFDQVLHSCRLCILLLYGRVLNTALSLSR